MRNNCSKCSSRSKARFKRRATAVPNSIARIKFDFGTAVARLGFVFRKQPFYSTELISTSETKSC